jgi:radical SAM superfamily enzyme YgiQ (UPF0313 family)
MILLLNPLQTATKHGGKKVTSNFGFGSDRRVYPPLDLCYIASCLKKNGFEIELIDANALELGVEKVEEIVKHNKYEYVIIPTSQYDRYQCMHLAIDSQVENINLIGKYAKTIIIGPHMTSLPEYYAKIIESKIFIRGESEMTILDIVNGKPLKDIEGLSYKKDNKLIHNPDRKPIENLDIIPLPKYELLPIEKYEWYYIKPSITTVISILLNKVGLKKRKGRKFFGITTSRGCPFDCAFCYHFYNHKVRSFSTERIKAEIDYMISIGVEEIRFEDDTFTLNKRNCIEICNFLKGKKLRWACQTRTDTIDKKLLEIMKDTGCIHIAFGVESVEPNVLKAINKDIPMEKTKEVISYASKIGIATQVNMLIGLPEETEHSLKTRKEFVISTQPNIISAGITIPYPQTTLYNIGKENRTIKGDCIEDIINAAGLIGNEFTKESVVEYLRNWQDFADYYNTLRWAKESVIIYFALKIYEKMFGRKRFLELARKFIPRYN